MINRILIGACGGLTGSYLVRQFKKTGRCTVVGADVDRWNVTRHFADEFVVLPNAKDPDFIETLISVLIDKQIDAYVPTHSREIRMVSQYEQRIRESWPGKFLVSPFETFQKLENKRVANRNMAAIGIPVPTQIDMVGDGVRYPIFMKPNIGSGSSQSQLILDEKLHRAYYELNLDVSFYEFLRGVEYTVDCMFDMSGRLIGYNPRTRLKSMGGAVIVTQNNYDYDIFPYLARLQEQYLFRGCVNFQYIVSDNVPYFIDVNLRYASGGLPLSVASGLDVPNILLALWEGKDVGTVRCSEANRKIMYRFFEEIFEDLDS